MQNPNILKLVEKRVEQMCKLEELKRIVKEKISQATKPSSSTNKDECRESRS